MHTVGVTLNTSFPLLLQVKYLGSHKWSELTAVKQRKEEAEKEKKLVKVDPKEPQGAMEDSKSPVALSNASGTSEVVASTKGNGGGWIEARRVQVSPKLSKEADAQVVSSATATILSIPSAVAHGDPKDKVDDDEKIEVSSIHSEDEAINADGASKPSSVRTVSVQPMVQVVVPTKSNSTPDKDRQEPKKKMIFFDYNDIDGNDDIRKIGEQAKQASPTAFNNQGKQLSTKVIRVEDKQGVTAASADSVDAELLRISSDGAERQSGTGKESWNTDNASGVSPTSLRSATNSADRKPLVRVNSTASSVDVIEPYASSSEDDRDTSLVRPQSLAVGDSTGGSKPVKVLQGKSPRDDSPERVEMKAVAVDGNLEIVEYDQQDANRSDCSSSSSSSSTIKRSRTAGNRNYSPLQAEVCPERSQKRRKKKTTGKKAAKDKDSSSNSSKPSDKRERGNNKDRHGTMSNESDGSSSIVAEEFHRQSEAYALPSQFKHQQGKSYY